MNLRRYLSDWDAPLSTEQQTQFQGMLQGIPELYEQAKSNLTDAAGDFADLALRYNRNDARTFDRIASRLQEYHSDLAADAERAGDAARGFLEWVAANKHTMTAPGHQRSSDRCRAAGLKR